VQQERDDKQKTRVVASQTADGSQVSLWSCGSVTSNDYRDYIASAGWRRHPSRLAEIEASGHRCRICDRGAPDVRLEVHHRRYQNLGCERVGDLTCLCADCHRLVTTELRRRRYAGQRLWSSADVCPVLFRSFGCEDGRFV